MSLIEHIKLPTACLHLHRCGNIQLWKKDGNALDDYAGGATRASIRKAVVVPAAVAVSRPNINGEVAGRLLQPVLPFSSCLSAAVLVVGAPGPFAALGG